MYWKISQLYNGIVLNKNYISDCCFPIPICMIEHVHGLPNVSSMHKLHWRQTITVDTDILLTLKCHIWMSHKEDRAEMEFDINFYSVMGIIGWIMCCHIRANIHQWVIASHFSLCWNLHYLSYNSVLLWWGNINLSQLFPLMWWAIRKKHLEYRIAHYSE